MVHEYTVVPPCTLRLHLLQKDPTTVLCTTVHYYCSTDSSRVLVAPRPLGRRNCRLICVCGCGCFPTYSGRAVRWMYQPGSHRRKVAQDFSSTFLLRCMPLFFSREGFSRSFPSSTVKSNFCVIVGHFHFLVRKNPRYRDSNSRPNVSEDYEVTN